MVAGCFGPSHRVASGFPRGGRIRRVGRFFCWRQIQTSIGSDQFRLGIGIYQDLREILSGGGAVVAHHWHIPTPWPKPWPS